MKIRLLLWFLFILYTQSVTILGFEDFPTSKIEDFNLSKPIFGEQLHGMRNIFILRDTERALRFFFFFPPQNAYSVN